MSQEKNVPSLRYLFHQRQQQQGETYEKYKMELRRLARTCDFANITPEEILRDRPVFGIRDDRVRERLLRKEKLTMKTTDEVCQAAESTRSHLSARLARAVAARRRLCIPYHDSGPVGRPRDQRHAAHVSEGMPKSAEAADEDMVAGSKKSALRLGRSVCIAGE